MRRARAFFFVCAGLLCLTLAYQLGASSSRATSSGTIEIPSFNGSWASGVVGRTVYTVNVGGPFVVQALGGVPGSDAVIASSSGGNVDFVMLANGDIYTGDLTTASWTYAGNLLSGSVPARSISIGQLKTRYAK